MRTSATTLSLLLALAATLGACADRRSPTAPAARRAGADAAARTFTSIDVPGSSGTFPLDINARGDIVGRYSSAGRTHGFFRDASGELTTIDFPGASFSVAGGINDSGVIAGWYSLPASPAIRHGFLLKGGDFTSFDPPGSTFTNALGINERGDVVGRFCTRAQCRQPGNGDYHGFLLHDGTFTVLDVPGADETNAWKIDERGAVVGGFGDVGGPEQLFVMREGAYAAVALPNGKSVSQDNGGINARGDVVGLYCDAALPCLIAATGTHGFVLSGDDFTTIDVPGALATSAIAINARRDVVGGYFDARGVVHGFLLSAGGRE